MNNVEMAHELRRMADVGWVNAKHDAEVLRAAADVLDYTALRQPAPFSSGVILEIKGEDALTKVCPACGLTFALFGTKAAVIRFCPVCAQPRLLPDIVKVGEE